MIYTIFSGITDIYSTISWLKGHLPKISSCGTKGAKPKPLLANCGQEY